MRQMTSWFENGVWNYSRRIEIRGKHTVKQRKQHTKSKRARGLGRKRHTQKPKWMREILGLTKRMTRKGDERYSKYTKGHAGMSISSKRKVPEAVEGEGETETARK